MKTVLVNLSNQLYKDSRNRLNESARRHGIEDILSWDFEEIKQTPFYPPNKAILDQPTGMGYWLWKPYILLEALKGLSDGDLVIYSDSGIEIIAPLDPLCRICREEQPILLFGNGDFTNSLWTKRDCFILMDCDEEVFWYGPHCDASFLLLKKSPFVLKFLQEWLEFACDKRILTDMPNTFGKKDLPEFREHRRDQSILSLLAQKYQVPLYRSPTQFGNHYKIYPYRLEKEFNCVNQYRQRSVRYYAVLPYYNSPYFQLLDHHRQKNQSVEAKDPKAKIMGFLRWLRSFSRTIRHRKSPGVTRVRKGVK
ncbi:MAG TPA: hypothetical protein VF939_23585 [Puia sp.]